MAAWQTISGFSYHIRLSQRQQRQYNKGFQGVQQVLHGSEALLKVLYFHRWQQVQGSQCQGQQFYA